MQTKLNVKGPLNIAYSTIHKIRAENLQPLYVESRLYIFFADNRMYVNMNDPMNKINR